MKTKSIPIGQLRLGAIIRYPMGGALYHRVKAVKLEGLSVHITLDGGRDLDIDGDEHVYVLEDEPAPIVLDGMKLG